MKITAKVLKWAIRFYPPLLFQRIWVINFSDDFKQAEIKINKSLLNINYNKTIFGGTIFSATDPFYAILFDQIFRLKGYKTRVWLKSASIQYLKPGNDDLYFKINITDEDISEAEYALNTSGKFTKAFTIEILNKKKELCASVINEVYIRNLYKGESQTITY